MTNERFAKVRTNDASAVPAYLPQDYSVFATGEDEQGTYVLIHGEDSLGWTMDDYVIPRLASGMHVATELTEDEWDDERTQILTNAGGEVVDALTKLYELTDGDEAAVGEQLYEIDKAARLRYHEQVSR